MDSGEPGTATKDPSGGGGKKGHDRNKGKGRHKGHSGGGEAEGQKGASKGKNSQQNWMHKAEADGSEEDQKPYDRKGKSKQKGDGRGDGKKESWKERRGKQHERFDVDAETGGNEAEGSKGKGGGKHRGHAGNHESNADSAPNAGALLNHKASAPSAIRYSREELLLIAELPASKVKPNALNTIIDKENSASSLLVKAKADKADRESRHRREGEEDYDEEAAAVAARRERRQLRADRRREEEGEEVEHGDRQRSLREEDRRGGRWGETIL